MASKCYKDVAEDSTQRRSRAETSKGNVLHTTWREGDTQNTQGRGRHGGGSQPLEASHDVEANLIADEWRDDGGDGEEDRAPDEDQTAPVYICQTAPE